MTPDDEPVGYLGGAAADEEESAYALPPAEDDPYGAPADDDAYALPPAEDDPYGTAEAALPGATDDEPEYALPGATDDEPEYALPGATDDEPEYALPGATEAEPEYALPPQEEEAADYSASDFMADAAPVDDPYAAAEEVYDDPYETQEAYDEYAAYEAGASEDDGYYDSLGHDDGLETGMATEPEVGYDTEEFADDDQPKTISQQDAESIIRRITTKRILPPEQQQAGDMDRPQLTKGGGGLKIWPILFVLLLVGGGGVFAFKDQIFGTGEKPTIVKETPKPTISAQERARRELVKRILTSEAKAFDREPAELLQADTKSEAPAGAAKTEEGK